MPPYRQPDIIAYSSRIVESFRHWTGKDLIELADTPEMLAEKLYHAPFVLVSHGTQSDPIFRYANLTAQKLWSMTWDKFITLPSRLSAEPDAQEERERLIQRAQAHGFVDDYQGIRITSDGRQFHINDCILWNVVDEGLAKIGQAATFSTWHF